ncbi:MAG: carboxypeptidase-like regulatory domain-containing protein [Cyclobacteriaceae bacterium]
MKTKFNLITTSFIIGLMALSISCKEQFTEEDSLNAQQLVDFAIYVFDQSSADEAPIAGATVTFLQGGGKVEATTDESGFALFPKVKFGGFVYTITAENFTSVTEDDYIDPDNFRQSQETYSVGLYSLNDENLATMKGDVRLETDLTNDAPEFMEGITLRFKVYLNNGQKVFLATTDSEGKYEVKLPVNQYGSTVEVQYPDMLINQKIAFNKLSTDPKFFPEVLPQVAMVETLFAMYTSGGILKNNSNYPITDVAPIYAIAEPAPNGQTTAEIDFVYTDEGEITDIDFNTGGNYAGDADGKVSITFTSLLGGSGASLVITLGDQTNLSSAYNGNGTASSVLVGGSGYPEQNYFLNRVGYRSPSLNSSNRTNSFYLYPGTITFNNPDYGTGVSRPDNLD